MTDGRESADFDVTILGGGLVGMTLALALEQPGFRVALVDPVPVAARGAPDFDGRAYAVAPGSAKLLSALGLWDALVPRAGPVSRIEVAERHRGPVAPARLHFDPALAGETALGWIVEDRFLRGALLDAVAASAIDHRAPARGEVVERGTGWARLEAGGPLRARLVVACDGRRSATARAAGIDYLGWDYDQTGLVSAIAHEVPHRGVAHQSFFPGGPFAVLPLPGNRSSIVWSERTARAREIAQMPDTAYLAEIEARIGGRLGRLELAGERHAHPLGVSLAESYAVPRLVVAGDAAHGVHPIAGQGLNMGFRDVAALVEVAVEAARRGEDIGALDVLQRYERWRRFDAAAMALGMDAINRLFSTDAAWAQGLRNLGLSAVGALPGAIRGFIDIAAGRAGDVPKLLQGRRP